MTIYHFASVIQLTRLPDTKEFLTDFADQLTQDLGLTIVDRNSYAFTPIGKTLVYILSQSHIAIHTWPEYSRMHLDLVSCVQLDKGKMRQSIEKLLHDYTIEEIKLEEVCVIKTSLCYPDYMTGRTHDLAAFTALNVVFVTMKVVPDMTFATVITALGANMLGGLLPDIDNATSDFWDKIRGGNILAKIVKPFVGKHRMLSHSLLGMVIIGFLLDLLLLWLKTFLIVDMDIIWWSVMIGVGSHLFTDGLTKQGIPLLFPLPIDFGFPPFEFMRMTTGKFVEKWIVRTVLIFANGYMVYEYYDKYLLLFKSFF